MSEQLVNIIRNELSSNDTNDIRFTIEKFDSRLFDELNYIKLFIEDKSDMYQINEFKIMMYKFFGVRTKSFYRTLDLYFQNKYEIDNLSEAAYLHEHINDIYSFFEKSYYLCKKSKTLYDFLVILVMQMLPTMYMEELLNESKFSSKRALINEIGYTPYPKTYSEIVLERDLLLSQFTETREYSIKRKRTRNDQL